MRRNHFELTANGHLLTAEQPRSRFVDSFDHYAPADRTTTIRHEQLMKDPRHVVELIMHANPAA